MKKLDFNLDWSCNGRKVRLPHDAQILETRSAEASDGVQSARAMIEVK